MIIFNYCQGIIIKIAMMEENSQIRKINGEMKITFS